MGRVFPHSVGKLRGRLGRARDDKASVVLVGCVSIDHIKQYQFQPKPKDIESGLPIMGIAVLALLFVLDMLLLHAPLFERG